MYDIVKRTGTIACMRINYDARVRLFDTKISKSADEGVSLLGVSVLSAYEYVYFRHNVYFFYVDADAAGQRIFYRTMHDICD